MRRTVIFFLELMQHTVVAVRRALPAIPEDRVIPLMHSRIDQRCIQYLSG
ncbi:hypothetical protein LMG28727_07773 [Paraburkholderia kirstenboschensis]|nr:hypothetical protein LMG28727_07773 [Paraburkholderia kirstenboschensis]